MNSEKKNQKPKNNQSESKLLRASKDARELRDEENQIDAREGKQDANLLKKHQMDCVEEVKVDPDLVIRFKAGDWRNDQPALKKWVLCILIRMGLMSPEGVYKFDEAMTRLSDRQKKKAGQLIDTCLSEKAMPATEIAWSYVHCLHTKDPLGNYSSLSIFSP